MRYLKRYAALLLTLMMALSLTVTAFAAVDDTGFSDVDSDAWYAEAVMYCKEHNLMAGIGNDLFAPESNLTRAQLAAVLYRIEGTPAVSGTDAFTDTPDGAWYSDAVLWASQQNLVGGYGGGIFGPDDPVSREQMTAILWRYADSPATASENVFTDEPDIANYAASAVDWADNNNIVRPVSNRTFAPKSNTTRAQVADALMNFDRIQKPTTTVPPSPNSTPSEYNRVLIAYFSATNNTESIANHLKAILDADIYEIVPETPYTSADLNYNTDCRANREQNDSSARPAISGNVDAMEQYDVIFLGYPIWWGQAPKIISTFLESYDFSGKTIVPFCTSGSSGIGSSATNLHSLASTAIWMDGQRFGGSASRSTVETWVTGLNLPIGTDNAQAGPAQAAENSSMLNLTINGITLTATLAENSSAQALRELLADGPITIDMRDYGNMEKVGSLGTSLPTNNEQINTQPGDIILYQGNQITIYYNTNSWSLTRLGKINDITAQELRVLLGSGDVSVTLSLG